MTGSWGNLVVSGSPVFDAGPFGIQAPYFNATSQGFATQGAKALGGIYSWLMWFRADAVPSAVVVGQPLDQLTQETIGFSWGHSTVGFRQAIYHRTSGGTFVPAKIQEAVAANVWYQIAGVYDGVNINCYLNGRFQVAAAAAAGSASQFQLLFMNSAHTELGSMDHFLIWRGRALSAGDILQLYSEPFAMLRGPGRSSGKVAA